MPLSGPIAIVSSSNAREMSTEDDILVDAFMALGESAEIVQWDDSDAQWGRFRALVIRTTWDYHYRLAEFLAWLKAVEDLVPVFNPPDLVRWNSDKRYLAELSEMGVPVVETLLLNSPDELKECQDRGWPSMVIKPSVAAGAYDTLVHELSGDDAWVGPEQHVQRIVEGGRVALAQPYIDGIVVEGETSLVFLDGEIRYAVRKVPAAGDFRVQSEFGGKYDVVEPRADQLAAARQCLASLPAEPIFARIDLVDAPTPKLMELEIIEPELFFPWAPQGALILADAVVESLVVS